MGGVVEYVERIISEKGIVITIKTVTLSTRIPRIQQFYETLLPWDEHN